MCLAVLPVVFPIIQKVHEAETARRGWEKESDLSQFPQLIRGRVRIRPWIHPASQTPCYPEMPGHQGAFLLSSRRWLSQCIGSSQVRADTARFSLRKDMTVCNWTSPTVHFCWCFKLCYRFFVARTLPWLSSLLSKVVAGRQCWKRWALSQELPAWGTWGSWGRIPRFSWRASLSQKVDKLGLVRWVEGWSGTEANLNRAFSQPGKPGRLISAILKRPFCTVHHTNHLPAEPEAGLSWLFNG